MLCILAFISGCAPTSNTNTVLAPVISLSTEVDKSPQEQAFIILQTADLSAENPQANRLKLNASGLFAQGNDHQNAVNTLLSIDTDNLSDSQFVEYSFLMSQSQIALSNPESAEEQLNQSRFIFLSSEFTKSDQLRLSEIYAELHFARGNHYKGFEALIDLTKSVKRKSDIRSIHDKIWQRISNLSYSQLNKGTEHNNIYIAGWFQLAVALRQQQGNPRLNEEMYNEWKMRWKSHPAAKIAPTQIIQSNRRYDLSSQIALLLPLQEPYKTPSYTLIEGFLDAYFRANSVPIYNKDKAPDIRIYDTSTGSIQSVYNQAVADGADMIVGPLRQSQVESLTTAPLLPIPTLALNRLDNRQLPQPENFYQFGLSPLDELTQIADRAWNKGARKLLFIAPDNNWGVQSATFFADYWTEKGGTLLEQVNYSASTNDFTQLLKPSLQIDLSEARGLQIKRFVNSRVNYTVRRRQDIDLVVMLGYPLKARQIKPALDFLYASDVPVIATSHIYNGDPQQEFDRDLSGIEFSSMPWTLNGHLPYDLTMDSKLHTAYRHLYALGHDAYLLHANLNQLQNSDSLTIYGATGMLTLEDNILVRQPKWAVFERGKVREKAH